MTQNSLTGFLEMIQERTSMYIGGRTIVHLKAFLDGWFFGREDDISDSYLLGDFQEWVQDRYKIKSTQSWAQIILFYSTDEYDALSNFFKLWSRFLENQEA